MELSPSGIPIIDLGPATGGNSNSTLVALADQVSKACEAAGCFYVKNHGVDYSIIDSLFGDLKSFFVQPLEYKLKYKLDYLRDRGYVPFETQNVNAFMGRLNLPNDPVEKLAFGPPYECNPPAAENLWPDKPSTLKDNVVRYYLKLRDLSDTLGRIFAIAIKAPDEDYFNRNCHDAPHSMKANWYPGEHKPKFMQSDRFAEHFDITPFTILASDSCQKSLRVKNANGDWVYADPVSGTLFVNLGNVLQRWTNDKWKATVHKVDWPDGDQIPDRLSVVYFVTLSPNCMIECIPSCCTEGDAPKYDPISYYDYYIEAMKRLSNVY